MERGRRQERERQKGRGEGEIGIGEGLELIVDKPLWKLLIVSQHGALPT